MTDINVTVTGHIRPVIRDLELLDRRLVPRAVSRGLTASARTVENIAVKEISKRAKVPQSRVRWKYTTEQTKTNRRRLRRNNPARHAFNIDALVVRFAFNPFSVPLATLGRPRQLKKGARAGQHRVEGAFVEDMGSGAQIWKRRGPPRWPADVQSVDLFPHVDPSFRRGLARGRRKFIAETERQVALAFEKRGFSNA